MKIATYITILFTFLIVSCSKDDKNIEKPIEETKNISPAAPSDAPTSSDKLKEVANFTENNHLISVKTVNGALYTGYNDVYLTITDVKTGKALSAEKVNFLPMMRMYDNGDSKKIKHSHSCPHTENLMQVNGNYYRGYAVFQMNTGELGHWDLNLNYTISGKEFQVKEQRIEIQKQPKESHLKFTRFKGKDGKMYILALISPIQHRNGRNDNVIAGLFKAESMVSFPQAKGFSLLLDPRMPGADMQNHSTPFDDFKAQPDGFHKANINYSMSGYWELNFQIKNTEGEVIAGTEIPKTPKTKEDFDAVSEVHLRIDIPEGK